MARLVDLLKHLDRPDVRELVVQTNSYVSVRAGSELKPVSPERLAPDAVIALIAGTPLANAAPAEEDRQGKRGRMEVNGRSYAYRIARYGDRLQIRLALSTQAAIRDSIPDRESTPDNMRGADARREPSRDQAAEPARDVVPRRRRVSTEDPRREPDEPPTEHTVMATPSGLRLDSAPAREIGVDPAAPRVGRQPAAVGVIVESATHGPVRVPTLVSQPAPVSVERVEASTPALDSDLGRLALSLRGADGEKGRRELNNVLKFARKLAASDVHIVSDRPVCFRTIGDLKPEGKALSHQRVGSMLLPLLDDRQLAQLVERGYADLAIDLPETGRMRVNVNRTRGGLKGCFRLIAPEPPNIEALGLPPELAQLVKHHQGLVVISGPNGQGKTTTLGALVDMFNRLKPVHIITVEDPIEILHPVKRAIVSQRQVGVHTESFQSALRAALREDPDVIAIGELRDRETVAMALSAAETGHLVFATMSAPSGARTIDRLIDMFPPDDQSQVRATLAGTLKFVVSQRLIPMANARQRVAAVELITGNIPLWTLIRDNKLFQLPSLLQRGRGMGMVRIEDSLLALMKEGLVTQETALHYAHDPRLLISPAQAR